MSDNVEDSQHDYELGIRSEEVYDIINSIPSWITRWGITVISVIVLSLVGLSWLLHYPDTIMIPLRLTANNAPKPVNSRTTGRLIKLLVREGEAVTAGQLLAFVESTASHAQVLALDLYLQQLSESLSRDFPSPGGGAHSTLGQLGELQPAYQTLQQNLTQYLNYQQKGYYQARRQMLQAELAELARAYTNLQEQKTLMQKDFAISKQDFAVQQELFTQKVIPATDFRREERKFLSEEITLKQMEARSFENNLAQSAKQKEILELNKVRSEQRSIMIQAVNTALSNVSAWKAQYTLSAPVGGIVSFTNPVENNQPLTINQEVFYISPTSSQFFGEALIPQQNLGKVREGQVVIVKFAGYPFQEFGSVKGQLDYLSRIPNQSNTFQAKIVFPNGLRTQFGKAIAYRQGMTATGEIITRDSRLIQKLFYNLREAINH